MLHPASNPVQQAQMNAQEMKADILKKLSRRNWLRNAAITATGAVVLPSFLTGCTKEQWDDVIDKIPGGGVGAEPPLTPEQLSKAVDNLNNMLAFVKDLYPFCIEYEAIAFDYLNSGEKPTNWTQFILDVFVEIGVTMFEAAELPFAAAAFAITADFLEKWGEGEERPVNLYAQFGAFREGHLEMQTAIEAKLNHLMDTGNNYSNLREAWTDDIVFNKTAYKLSDLAKADFPKTGDAYNTMHATAFTQFKQGLWNLMIMKCCTYYRYYWGKVTRPNTPGSLRQWALEEFYPEYKPNYMRALWVSHTVDTRTYEIYYWNLGIGGYPFSDELVNELFIDSVPGHEINKSGLFTRSHVFQQFSITKPNFKVPSYYSDDDVLTWELASTDNADFALNNDWNFTGGMFPKLIKT